MSNVVIAENGRTAHREHIVQSLHRDLVRKGTTGAINNNRMLPEFNNTHNTSLRTPTLRPASSHPLISEHPTVRTKQSQFVRLRACRRAEIEHGQLTLTSSRAVMG